MSSSNTFELDSIPFNSGFSSANLSIVGLQTSSVELVGDLSSITGALQILSLKGNEAGNATVTVNARDTLGLSAESQSFNVSLEIGDPSKPDLPSNIKSGVSVDELSAGFPVIINIAGTGVKTGDKVTLFSSLNSGAFEIIQEKNLLENDLGSGMVEFYVDPLGFPAAVLFLSFNCRL